MELSKDPEKFIACVKRWLDEPRFADREVEGKNMMVDKGDWHGAWPPRRHMLTFCSGARRARARARASKAPRSAGSTLLHFAVFHDDADLVQKLLDKGAD